VPPSSPEVVRYSRGPEQPESRTIFPAYKILLMAGGNKLLMRMSITPQCHTDDPSPR
jgi:hypothetical protein